MDTPSHMKKNKINNQWEEGFFYEKLNRCRKSKFFCIYYLNFKTLLAL